MRQIEILDNLKLRFPERGPEFDLGIEVAAAAVLMAQGEPLIQRQISSDAVEQLRPLAERFRFALVASPAANGLLDVSLTHKSRRPRLRVV